jgi:hypothetical protein
VTVSAGGIAVLGLSWNGSGSFTDADLAGDTFTATVNYADNTGTVPLTLTGTNTFVLSHTYSAILATAKVTVTISDSEGMSGSGSTTVTVIL